MMYVLRRNQNLMMDSTGHGLAAWSRNELTVAGKPTEMNVERKPTLVVVDEHAGVKLLGRDNFEPLAWP
ncbi:hypothetical protein WJ84_03725 [Burkholderia ubonensis]|nr:hypothetical protein WJ84_03725 [Burkholderia ubonensis]KVP39529.1 hypothetical protein WJ87_04645 [Burkholderia ubonensis]